MDLTRATLAAIGLTTLGAVGARDASGAMLDPYAAARLSVPADLNFDGVVDSRDLAIVLGEYGNHLTGGADLNGDGVVDTADMALVLGDWSNLPSINAPHMTGDARGWRIYVDSVVTIERSPLRSDWTRIWAFDIETGQIIGFDVDVYAEYTLYVLLDRQWGGPRTPN